MRRNDRIVSAGIVGVRLVLAAHAWAAVTGVVASGTIDASTKINDTSGGQRCINPNVHNAFSLDPGPPMISVIQPICTFTGFDQSFVASASTDTTAGVTHVVSGSRHTFTVQASGVASAHSNFPMSRPPSQTVSALSQVTLVGAIGFQITDHEERIAINPIITGSGFRFGDVFTLSTPTGDFRFGHDGTNDIDLPDTLPRSSIQPPGFYSVGFIIDYGALETQGNSLSAPDGAINLNLTVTVGSAGDEIHWINPAGGDFNVVTNWNPRQLPMFDLEHSDTAIFDLSGNDAPIPILGRNNAVGGFLIRHMNVDLNGPVRVLGSTTDVFDFAVADGGTLVLDNGVVFITSGAGVGAEGGEESSVFVSGAGTNWTNLDFGPVLIGNAARGTVVVDHDGVLDAQKSIIVGDTSAGELRVESGGHVTTPNCTLNKGSIEVRGRGASAVAESLFKIASDLDIGGQNGTGSVVIEGGGGITADRVLVGDRAAMGRETVTISGVDDTAGQSTLGTDGELHVAGNAGTQIEVKDGGVLSTLGPVRVGENLAVGKVLVHGKSGSARASWDAFGDVSVGGQLTASELVIEDGGQVTGGPARQMALGLQTGEIGRASVSGSDSVLRVGRLVVGSDGHGELVISDDAFVQSATGIVGQSHNAGQGMPPPGDGSGSGSVTIKSQGFLGSRSEWLVTGNCFVGTDEPGTVTLLSPGIGATLRVNGAVMVGSQGVIRGIGQVIAGQVANDGTIFPGLLTVVSQGLITGIGRLIAGQVVNDTTSPGLSPGSINIDGAYEQGADGVLKIAIAGLGAEQFSVLTVTGDATLNGMLEVRFLDGFLPKHGDSVDFLQVGGTIAGAFAQMTFPNLAPGFDADLAITADGNLRFTARTDAAPRCAGDCDGSGTVSINEILTLVDIVLEDSSVDRCLGGDTSGDEAITVNEILAAVSSALGGCR